MADVRAAVAERSGPTSDKSGLPVSLTPISPLPSVAASAHKEGSSALKLDNSKVPQASGPPIHVPIRRLSSATETKQKLQKAVTNSAALKHLITGDVFIHHWSLNNDPKDLQNDSSAERIERQHGNTRFRFCASSAPGGTHTWPNLSRSRCPPSSHHPHPPIHPPTIRSPRECSCREPDERRPRLGAAARMYHASSTWRRRTTRKTSARPCTFCSPPR